MATQFKGACRITGVQVGEIRVREIGRSPSIMAKMALMTDDGASAGLYIQHMWSERTQKILQTLIASMELDAANALSDTSSPYQDDDGYDDEDDDDNEGLNFG